MRLVEAKVPTEPLREIGLFGGLSEEVLRTFVGELPVTDHRAGDVVFREGDPGREMYVLLAGEMEVIKRSKRAIETRVAILGPGDWFGEMSILDVQPRSATVRALAPSRLLGISAHDLDALYRSDQRAYALVVLNIAREMSRRLRVADGILADLVASVLVDYAGSSAKG